MTAYQNARAATPPQKGLTYSELLMDNLIGLDNEYLSAGERLGQQFNADPLGFLKGAGISAYEGAKGAVTSPIETIQGVGDAIYGSGEDLFRGIDSKVQELFGVGYDDATPEQVTQAREALIGDVMGVSQLVAGPAALPRKGLASLPFRGERRAQERIAELDALRAERQAEFVQNNDDFLPDIPDTVYRRGDLTDPLLPEITGPRVLDWTDPEGQSRIRYFDDQFPAILEDVQLGRPLTEREAFDVLMYERYGDYGILDPNNTFDDWLQMPGDDIEGARRIAYLMDPTNPDGRAEPVEYDDIYDQLNPPNDMEVQPQGAPFLAVEDMLGFGPDEVPAAPARFADWDDLEYERLEMRHDMDEVDLSDAQTARLRQYDTVRLAELQNGAPPLYTGEDEVVSGRLGSAAAANRSFEVRPSIGQAEGIAGLYSPTRKAVDLLDRPSYDNLDSLRVQLINRGAKPDELGRLTGRLPGGPVSKEDLARFADEASQDVVVSTRNLRNSLMDNPVYLDGSYFLKGAEDMGANVFETPVGERSVPYTAFSGLEPGPDMLRPAAPATAFEHFGPSAEGRAPVLHTRFGMFRSPGSDKPDTYHLGEIQSDWGQTRQTLFSNREEYAAAKGKIDELVAKSDELEQERRPLARTFEGETPEQLDKRVKRFRELSAEIARLDKESEALSTKMSDTESYGTRDEFDANYPAPYVGTTSKWVQLGLRQSLLDAVNKGAKRMTLSTGEQVKGYTFGKQGGQSKFYDDIVPKELEAVLKKFAKEAGIQKPEITTSKIIGSRGQEYMVPTVEFTDEFVEALKRVGLPAYAKGGIVRGSYLDNDPLEPALY
jgi:hypothetical protein